MKPVDKQRAIASLMADLECAIADVVAASERVSTAQRDHTRASAELAKVRGRIQRALADGFGEEDEP